MRNPQTGIQDFRQLRDGNYLYVDKSMLIGRILDNGPAGSYLFTRPRRFGKSMNLSMLDAFFNIKYGGNHWFDDLLISEHHEYDGYRNAFPVIRLSLHAVCVDNFDTFVTTFFNSVKKVYKQHSYLKSSTVLDTYERNDYECVVNNRDPTMNDALAVLEDLVWLMYRHYGHNVVLLIDEYDSPMNESYGTDIGEKINRFMGNVLSSVVKGNDQVQISVLTGVMQIAKESIFSCVNNLYVDNILSTRHSEMFGFTDAEVRMICEQCGRPDAYATVKEWYDGYRFGDSDVYNPWSVMSCVFNGFEPGEYWANTGRNDIVDDLLERMDAETCDELRMLGEGKTVTVGIDANVTYDRLGDRISLYSAMAMSGYLNVIRSDGPTMVTIPNREIYAIFAKAIMHRMSADPDSVLRFAEAATRNDTEGMTRFLVPTMELLSTRFLTGHDDYQIMVTCLLMALRGRYAIDADHEHGDGNPDIWLRCVRGDLPNIVIEVKTTDSPEADLDALAESAIQQILDRRYVGGMSGRTLLYGLAFRRKAVALSSRTVDVSASGAIL